MEKRHGRWHWRAEVSPGSNLHVYNVNIENECDGWSNILRHFRAIVVTIIKEAGPEERRMVTGISTIQMETYFLVHGHVTVQPGRVP